MNGVKLEIAFWACLTNSHIDMNAANWGGSVMWLVMAVAVRFLMRSEA